MVPMLQDLHIRKVCLVAQATIDLAMCRPAFSLDCRGHHNTQSKNEQWLLQM